MDQTNVSRRSFLGGIGVVGAGLAATTLGVSEAQATLATDYDLGTDIDQHVYNGGTTLTLREINQHRHEIVEAAGEETLEDGTVCSATWNKAYSLFGTYGAACPVKELALKTFQFALHNDESLAQAYIEMPYGVKFTALRFAEESGRSLEEAVEICETIASCGIIHRSAEGGLPVYNHMAYAFGVSEALDLTYAWSDEYAATYDRSPQYAAPFIADYNMGGGPILYVMPADRSVIAESSEVLLDDDLHTVIDSNELISLVPCQCGMKLISNEEGAAITPEEMRDYILPVGTHLETCLAFGDNAEYYEYLGVGRLISKEEAHAIVDRATIDEGLVPTSVRSSKHEVVCLCHVNKCGVLPLLRAMDPTSFDTSALKRAYSRYELTVNQDECLKCGMCANRCAMQAVTMGEDGYPVTDVYCISCGQCGITCPASARKLVAKPVEERLPLADCGVTDNNERAGYRIEIGVL